jgi:hypothetical protein
VPTKKSKPVIGWREWIYLPTLTDTPMKAKVDTGARTSALHAFGLKVHQTIDGHVATFEVHPRQRSAKDAVEVTCAVRSFRDVRSSNGSKEKRPVIELPIRIGEFTWPIEVTLTSRDAMGFRMLLGRAAIRSRFVIDPGRSYVLSRTSKERST